MNMSDLMEQKQQISVEKSYQVSVGKSNPFLLTHFTHYTYFTHFMNQLAATWAQGPWAWAHVAASWFIQLVKLVK